ncbi:DUF4111 domain-containing protein [Virgibacillus proomii]|nr:DUF4111 domain-containing protein [Virgibacillus proomii]
MSSVYQDVHETPTAITEYPIYYCLNLSRALYFVR